MTLIIEGQFVLIKYFGFVTFGCKKSFIFLYLLFRQLNVSKLLNCFKLLLLIETVKTLFLLWGISQSNELIIL
ncbi:small multidrug resistance protein [Ureaplasma parvum serovar 3]|nr:small multidrug resistance protein [Ureaplasma parvum serovar 3]